MFYDEGAASDRDQALEMILNVLSASGSREKTKKLKKQVEQVFPKDRVLHFAIAKEWLAEEQQYVRLQEMTDKLIESLNQWERERINPFQRQMKALELIKKMLQTDEETEEVQRFIDLQGIVELGLEIRFGREGKELCTFIRRHVTDIEVLEELVEALKTVETIDELREIYE